MLGALHKSFILKVIGMFVFKYLGFVLALMFLAVVGTIAVVWSIAHIMSYYVGGVG